MFFRPPTPALPLMIWPVPIPRRRTPPLALARLSGLGQPRPGQAPVERSIPFSCEPLPGRNLGARLTRKVVNSVVVIVPDRGSRSRTLRGLLPVPPMSLANPSVPFNTLVAVVKVKFVKPPPLKPGPVLLYRKTIGAAPIEMVLEALTVCAVKGSLPEMLNWTGVAAPPHVPLIWHPITDVPAGHFALATPYPKPDKLEAA